MKVLELRGLRVSLETDRGTIVAVEDSSLSIEPGETLALVGESGAGKTMTAMAIMGLVPPNGRIETGEVLFSGRNLFELEPEELRQLRGNELAMIFQDPNTALNPLLPVGRQLTEVLAAHGQYDRKQSRRRCVDALAEVGLPDPEQRFDSYPHELSGGQRQRVMIAMALLLEPAVLIADEPTTALDVTVQAQILDLLRELQERRGTAILLVTHDLGVVASMAHRVAVMYAGAVVEVGSTEEVFRNPFHPYTFALLQSLPNAATPLDEPLPTLPGQPPDPIESVIGCPFEPRCPFRTARCASERPAIEQLRGPDADIMRRARMLAIGSHRAACFEQEQVGSLTALWSQSLEWGVQSVEQAERDAAAARAEPQEAVAGPANESESANEPGPDREPDPGPAGVGE